MEKAGSGMTRREAVHLLGAGGGAGLLAGSGLLAMGERLSAAPRQQAPILRTLQGDIAPGSLEDGAVLFHEHLSIQLGPNPSFHSDVDLMIEEARAARADGIALIVDGGHPDMARDLAALQRSPPPPGEGEATGLPKSPAATRRHPPYPRGRFRATQGRARA
jgi:hypothetical protein